MCKFSISNGMRLTFVGKYVILLLVNTPTSSLWGAFYGSRRWNSGVWLQWEWPVARVNALQVDYQTCEDTYISAMVMHPKRTTFYKQDVHLRHRLSDQNSKYILHGNLFETLKCSTSLWEMITWYTTLCSCLTHCIDLHFAAF